MITAITRSSAPPHLKSSTFGSGKSGGGSAVSFKVRLHRGTCLKYNYAKYIFFKSSPTYLGPRASSDYKFLAEVVWFTIGLALESVAKSAPLPSFLVRLELLHVVSEASWFSRFGTALFQYSSAIGEWARNCGRPVKSRITGGRPETCTAHVKNVASSRGAGSQVDSGLCRATQHTLGWSDRRGQQYMFQQNCANCSMMSAGCGSMYVLLYLSAAIPCCGVEAKHRSELH